MKSYKVINMYWIGMFSKAGQHNIGNDLYCYSESVAYFDGEDLEVSYYQTSDAWSDQEYFFDTLEEATLFCEKQIEVAKEIKIDERFEADFYEIWKYDEEEEEYTPILNEYGENVTYNASYLPKL